MTSRIGAPSGLILGACASLLLVAVGQADTPERTTTPSIQRRGQAAAGVFKTRIVPTWSDDERWLWYRNELPNERREFILIDVAKGKRQMAFDHTRLATALSEAVGSDFGAERLPIEDVRLDMDGKTIEFRVNQQGWRCQLSDYSLTKITLGELSELANSTSRGRRSDATDNLEMQLLIVNETDQPLELFWMESAGVARSYGAVARRRGAINTLSTAIVGKCATRKATSSRSFAASASEPTITIAKGAEPLAQRRRRRDSGDSPRSTQRGRSPNGKWSAIVKEHNLFLRNLENDQETQLTNDGVAEQFYGMPQWSPDSQTLAAFQIQPGDQKEVHFVESSPSAGGRALLHTRRYPLPGDRFTSYRLCLFHAETRQPIACQADPIDFGRPRLRWRKDGKKFTYEQVDRGHQRFRLVEVNARDGAIRNVIDERSTTFIWTAHAQGIGMPLITWLNENELIYSSERDGWRRLYLVDVDSGDMAPITSGQYVVRGIERIDQEEGRIWFRACGMNEGEDPYHVHHYRIDFSGQNLVALTAGDGDHAVEYSPSSNLLIDTYSRADMPPVHELRRAADGKLVCELERADATQLIEQGYRMPEVFCAKGRDGETDIWGVIHRPSDYDPARKYPVIESIYAGPHDAHVPKRFSARSRYRALNQLGFIVVQIDGMGTAHRGKAFHDVCWKNLKDAGLPDRIAWIKAAAQKDPAMDMDRVGIFGGSAGGQNAAGALLFHPDFYQAAVANCGCHDNRMDKASWNEQWMGFPVDESYSQSSNIDNAHRLQGKLFLVVGEMDTNVPPESTLRFADALIRANKDFDLLVVPGGGHGAGGAYGQRRLHDFFVRCLQDRDPPNRNADSIDDAAAGEAPSPDAIAKETAKTFDLLGLDAEQSPAARLEARYRADLSNLTRFYPPNLFPITTKRISRFHLDWLVEVNSLAGADVGTESDRGRLLGLRERIERAYLAVQAAAHQQADIKPLLPFQDLIADLVADKLEGKRVDAKRAAADIESVVRMLDDLLRRERRAASCLRSSGAVPGRRVHSYLARKSGPLARVL